MISSYYNAAVGDELGMEQDEEAGFIWLTIRQLTDCAGRKMLRDDCCSV